MKVFVDTNVFIASLTDEPDRGDTATRFLAQDFDFCTSVFNLMEIRSVMMKKKRIEQAEVEVVLDDVADQVDIYTLDMEDQVEAYQRQRETVLYTLDCVLMALSDDIEAEFVTFDAELLEHGCVSPGDLL